MRERVPLVTHGDRMGSKLFLAERSPAITAISQEVSEQAQLALVAADCGRSQMLLAGERQRPLVHVRSRPRPRKLIGESQEASNQMFPLSDRLIPQPSRGLLRPPTAQHCLGHRLLRPQL